MERVEATHVYFNEQSNQYDGVAIEGELNVF